MPTTMLSEQFKSLRGQPLAQVKGARVPRHRAGLSNLLSLRSMQAG